MVTSHREVEHKLEVDESFVLPPLDRIAGIAAVRAHEPFTMRAVYYDTDDVTLFRWKVTLRRREGGSDAGWHLKLPVFATSKGSGSKNSARDELRLPLRDGDSKTTPAALTDVVSPLLRGQSLRPVVVVETTRTPVDLLDDDGTAVAEVVDDLVRGIDIATGRVVGSFREIEVEAVDGNDEHALALIDDVARQLVKAGAEPSSMSKAARLLGVVAAGPADVPDLPMPGPDALAVDVISAVIAKHVRHLLISDSAVRRDLPDSVHQMRVACRRLRSCLKAFGPLLDPRWVDPLREELRWIADELGAIRDTEVLLTHLDANAERMPEADAVAARAVIDPWLRQRLTTARAGALAALRSDRHDWLVDDLVDAVHEPHALDAAYRPASEVLPPLAHAAWKPLDKAARRLDEHASSEDWHRARIKAKGARYVAEALAPVFGKPWEDLASALADLTEVLGEHQDAAVAQEALHELAVNSDPETAFVLGRLAAVEADVEHALRADAAKPWKAARKAAKKAGVE